MKELKEIKDRGKIGTRLKMVAAWTAEARDMGWGRSLSMVEFSLGSSLPGFNCIIKHNFKKRASHEPVRNVS